MPGMKFDDLDLPEPIVLSGDPVLRTLVGMVDSGEVGGDARVIVNVAGQMIAGTLISAADYAAATDDVVSTWDIGHEIVILREALLMAAPDEDDTDPHGYLRADYLHLRRDSDPAPERWRKGGAQLWRAPIMSVDSWCVAPNRS